MDLDALAAVAERENDRQEGFERSTLSLLLGWMGWSKDMIKEQDDLSWDWFNGEDLIDPVFGSGKGFRFSFEEFFLKPKKHPIVLAALEFGEQAGPKTPWVFCFNVYGHGRMAATNCQLKDLTHIHVVHPGGMVNIAPFKSVVSPWVTAPDFEEPS